jgi:hypothetical protein
MFRRPFRPFIVLLWAAALATVSLAAATAYQRSDADLLKRKVAGISAFAAEVKPKPHQTTITENELNAYLEYDGRTQLPAGVVDPVVTIVGNGRVSARAVVDLDQVRKQRNSTSVLDPINLLGGRVPVTAIGTVRTGNGVGRIQLESATAAGVPIPVTLLQQIVSYYSRSPENPSGINLDDGFAPPARIREIQVQQGRAVIVQ